jgi:hypothetical protein
MSRKDYVIKVTEQMAANAKAVLAGHGLKGNFQSLIAKRPDVIAKLAVLAYSSRTAAKGGKALQKKSNFKITAYANFANFNFQARQDVETFMGKLPAADQENFSNDNNILTLLVLNDTATGNVEADIVNGKSVALPFSKSVMNQYKMGNGVYIVIMFGDSWILPREEKLAKAKEKTNKRIAARMTPAKVRASLISKANAKKADLKSEAILLKNKASILGGGLEQFNDLAAAVGADGSDPKAALAAIKAYNSTNKALLKGLDTGDLAFYNKAAKLYIKGKTAEANRILDEIGIPQLTALVRGGNITSTDKIVAARKKALLAKVKEISAANEDLLNKVAASTDSKFRGDTNFKIRANVAKIKELRARATSFGELTNATTIKSKAKLLEQANALIAANIAKGQSVQAALQSALAKLPIDDETKEQVRQDIIEGVSQEVPMQYAVQQAIQNIPAQQQLAIDELDAEDDENELDLADDLDIDENAALSGSKSIQQILANL